MLIVKLPGDLTEQPGDLDVVDLQRPRARLSLVLLLHLPQALNTPLTVLIEGREVFEAEAGRINQNRAVKLVRKLEKE